jgi:hypothetical protein
MRGEAEFDPAELTLIIGTRAALGIGLGFLLGNALSEEQRRTAGWTLLLAGAVAATALGWEIFGRPRPFTLKWGTDHAHSDRRSDMQDRVGQPAMR